MCFVIMELFTNLSPNGTTEHFPISRESKNNTYVVYYINITNKRHGENPLYSFFLISQIRDKGGGLRGISLQLVFNITNH